MQRKMLISSALALTMVCAGACAGVAGAVVAAAPKHAHHHQPLTRAEAQANAAKLFDRLDVNHDGKIDAADRTAHIDAMFDKLDTNHDGAISRDEFRKAHEHGPGMAMGMGMGMHGDADAPPPPPADGMGPDQPHHGGRDHQGGRGHHENGMMMAGMLMHMADPGHTGTVTRDGFIGAALRLFDEADANHDGVVTGEERAAERGRLAYRMREAMRARWQAHHGAGEKAGPNAPPPPQVGSAGTKGG